MGKISLQMYTMRAHTQTLSDLEKTIEKLAEIGFKMLQYSIPEAYDAKAVYDIFEKNGITNDSVFTPFLKIEENTKTILEQCELFQTDYVRIDSMPKDLSDSPAGYKMYAHCLNEAAAELKKHGKKLLYHFHAFEFIRFGNETANDNFLKESDPEVIQIIPDTHWIHSGGKSVTEFLTKYKDRYDYIHAKDFGISKREGIFESRPICFAPVGEGNLDWKPIIDLAKSNGVKSYAIEQDDCYGRDPFDCVKSSYNFLRQIGAED